ncbi:MAG: N-acetylmuramoyl-L-alanine amidase [Acetobacter sp.]|nr:N-acetylmuramoyl-L-alanine amidase [Acetobacter sp.]
MFAPTSKQASCQYGIGSDGRVGMYCEEKNRSWCSSSNANDQRAITIECASDTTHPYAFKDVVYNKLIDLCVDICQRYGKTKLLWLGDKDKTLNYNPASNEMVLTVHRWFANKSCPGDWMYSRMGDLATKVTARLGGTAATTPQITTSNVRYQCKVTAKDGLNCRTQATTSSTIVKTYPTNTILTISKEQNNWGYTGDGWVSLDYVSKINSTVIVAEEEQEMTQEQFNKMMNNYMNDLASKDTSWAQDYLTWAKENGIMSGDEKGRMMPLKFCTRQEAVVMMKRLYELIKSGK